jgi:hypothetical protein
MLRQFQRNTKCGPGLVSMLTISTTRGHTAWSTCAPLVPEILGFLDLWIQKEGYLIKLTEH